MATAKTKTKKATSAGPKKRTKKTAKPALEKPLVRHAIPAEMGKVLVEAAHISAVVPLFVVSSTAKLGGCLVSSTGKGITYVGDATQNGGARAASVGAKVSAWRSKTFGKLTEWSLDRSQKTLEAEGEKIIDDVAQHVQKTAAKAKGVKRAVKRRIKVVDAEVVATS